MRYSALVVALACAAAMAACGDVTTSQSANTPTVAARLFTLAPGDVPAYTRDIDTALTPAVIADQLQLPNLQQVLVKDGMVSGAESEYAPQSGQTPTFDTVDSRALVFNDTAGATSYFAAEQKRIDVAPDGGTIAALVVHTMRADASYAYTSSLPAGPSSDIAYIFLARKGRVVVELFAHPGAGTPAASAFQSLVTMQDALLATSPDVHTSG